MADDAWYRNSRAGGGIEDLPDGEDADDIEYKKECQRAIKDIVTLKKWTSTGVAVWGVSVIEATTKPGSKYNRAALIIYGELDELHDALDHEVDEGDLDAHVIMYKKENKVLFNVVWNKISPDIQERLLRRITIGFRADGLSGAQMRRRVTR